ncbi:alpha-hydroxyketone-type quorum-sensing autoinducer synthase [Vibrio hippocampi]|uniref:CAI-1 autoinducer synthase n=1 Tax=Vibrio hippocampi TaxID=654686 RepID=A0ABN8DJV7_9VIBR|nr:alpha-hydroxyketone-type quorum-sensing autoinducer synthase [Vibrio hippocampi]CAH0529634.1 CAI-1 autoinducer synthase [Vibrio hippocampi]
MNIINNATTLPEFVSTKVEQHLEQLIYLPDSGKNLVVGKQPNPEDIVLQSNDYLDLSNNEEINRCHADAILTPQQSTFMSGVFLHDGDIKQVVEQRLSNFAHFSSCSLFQSGWIANIALLQTICDQTTHVYIDFFAHASLWEGARTAGANLHPFMHNNVRHFEKLVKRNGPGILIVDSIYSTLGTIAPLKKMIEIAKQYGCAIVVDESHSLGTHGSQGAGLLQQLGLSHQVDFMTASLAKAFAYRAGAVWCNNRTNEVIPYAAYPSIFSSTLLPSEICRIDATLDVIIHGDERRARLANNAKLLAKELQKIGFNIRSESHIVSLETGSESNTKKVRDFLESKGVFGSVFCRPATTPTQNIIRFSINCSVTKQQIQRVVDVCKMAYQIEAFTFR